MPDTNTTPALFAEIQLEQIAGPRGGLETIAPIGEPISLDVTREILRLSHRELVALKDNQYESDFLAEPVLSAKAHVGPYSVAIEEALNDWLTSQGLLAQDRISAAEWDLFIKSKLRRFAIHWTKNYFASGSEIVYALDEQHAKAIGAGNIGDWEGTMQYAPDQDEIEAFRVIAFCISG